MLPLTSSFWSTSRTSKSAYLLSRTPRAMFSKSQNSARLRSPLTTAGSCSAGIGHPHVDASILGDRRITASSCCRSAPCKLLEQILEARFCESFTGETLTVLLLRSLIVKQRFHNELE